MHARTHTRMHARMHACTHTVQFIYAWGSPGFVGDNYFWDTGSAAHCQFGFFYGEDPLWDEAGCGPQSTCCSFNNPPWFHWQFPQPTSDDIEMRVCKNEGPSNEDMTFLSIVRTSLALSLYFVALLTV